MDMIIQRSHRLDVKKSIIAVAFYCCYYCFLTRLPIRHSDPSKNYKKFQFFFKVSTLGASAMFVAPERWPPVRHLQHRGNYINKDNIYAKKH